MKTKTELGYSIHGGKYNSAFALDREGFENVITEIVYGNNISSLKSLYSEKTIFAIIDGFETYLADHYRRVDLFKMGVYGNIKVIDDFIRSIGEYVDSEFITTTVYVFTDETENMLDGVAKR